MQRLDGRLVLSPTDLTHHQECAHLTRLDLGVAAGEWAAPVEVASPELDLIFERGLEHEKKYLESLRAEGKSIVEIDTVFDAEGRRRAEAATVEAMRSGADVVYQGTFFDGAWGGQADFLLRVETPSLFGDWSYEIADTKLARKLKVAALLQMATYAERLTVLQGVAPEWIHVVTGDGVSRPWRLIDVAPYARRARARLEAFVEAPPATGPAPIGYCEQCRWAEKCTTELRQADDLGLVAFMRGDHRDALRAVGIATLEDLATATPELLKSSGIGADARTRLQQQAAEQLRERTTGPPSRTLLDPCRRTGAAAPAAAERRRPLPRLRGRSLVRGRRGHRVPRRPRRHGGRLHRAVGARPGRREADGRRPDRPADRGRAGRSGHARLPLRALRGDRAQEADRRLRRARGGARPAAARGAVRRPLSRRPAVDADQQGVVLDQEGRGVLRPVARGRGGQRARQRADVRAVAGGPRPAEARRHRVRTTRTTSTRPASCTSGWSSSAPSSRRCTARSRGRCCRRRGRPRRSATSRPRSSSWPGDCTTPATSCSATSWAGTAARTARLVGRLPAEDAGPGGADRRRFRARRAVRAGRPRRGEEEPAVRVHVPGAGHEAVRRRRRAGRRHREEGRHGLRARPGGRPAGPQDDGSRARGRAGWVRAGR